MIMEQFLLALCGRPSSGKTTLAHAIREALDANVTIVSSDDWRDADYYKDWRPEKEGMVRQATLVQVDRLLRQGKSVIHDDTNYYESMRHDLFNIALERECIFAVVHVTTSLEDAISWNRKRESTEITEDIIRRIDERFDPPGGRYLWDHPVAEVDMAGQSLDSAVAKILEVLDGLKIAEEQEPTGITDRAREMIDKITREAVTEFLEKHPELRGNREVSDVRRSVLKKAIESNLDTIAARKMTLKQLRGLLDG